MRTILLILFAVGLIPAASAAGPTDRPNIVFILADDLGWADLSCYGNELHETPNLDRLADQGVRLTDAYAASPVCTPTRAAILTGKHPARLHMTIWRESAKKRGKRKMLQPVCLDSLPLEHVTLAEVLGQAGYFNAHIGKWPVSAIRRGDWKLLEYFEDGRLELFDLKRDIGEQTDLASEHPEIAQRLADELQAWRREVDAQLPEPNPQRE